MFLKKILSDLTTTGFKANFQNIPRYVISYHVVCFGEFELTKNCMRNDIYTTQKNEIEFYTEQELYTPITTA